jgi:nascent polypeptide-associated complex subunit alpha
MTEKPIDIFEGVEEDDDEDQEMLGGGKNLSRGEKKARKAMAKLGLKPLKCARVAFKTPKNILFVISQPDVYKSAVSDTYIIFGEAKVEDLNQAAQQAQQFKQPPKVQEITEDEQQVDAGDIEEKDIELVIQQANVSRSKAIQALKVHPSNLV